MVAPSYVHYEKLDDGTTIRRAHLLTMIGHSTKVNPRTGQPLPAPKINVRFLEMTIAAYLAWRDLEARQSDILPNLPELMGDCDLHWSLEIMDTQASRALVVGNLVNVIGRPFDELPAAIVGPVYASASLMINELAGAGMGMVHMNGGASARTLDRSPLFARTIPTNGPVAMSLMQYFSSLEGVEVRRVGIVYSLSGKGFVEMAHMLQGAARAFNIKAVFFGIAPGSFDQTTSDLKNSNIKYVLGLLNEAESAPFLRFAVTNGAIHSTNSTESQQIVWYFLGRPQYVAPQFSFDRSTQADLAQAFHGSGVYYGYLPASKEFNQVYQQWTQSAKEQELFLSKMATEADRQLFQNHTFRPTALSDPLHILTYDAVIALGIAACRTPGNFTGHQLHQQVLKTKYTGVTGEVQFDPYTGTRKDITMQYGMRNIHLSDQRSTNTTFFYDAELVATIKGNTTTTLSSFTYPSNSTIPPPNLPPMVDYDYNLIPIGIQSFAWALSCLVMVSSIALIVWTLLNRTTFVVSAAQPIFLIQLCIGTTILASSIIPLGFQGEEESVQLDRACTSAVWLFHLGLAVSLSALASKTWRIHRLLDGSHGLRRVKVTPQDVAQPLIILFLWNMSLLIAWTVVAPPSYVRTEGESVDEFGRSTGSHGQCRPFKGWGKVFALLCVLGDLVAVVFVSVQCYKVRNMSTFFAETSALAWSTLSLVEAAIVLFPIVVALRNDPSPRYLASSVMIAALCFAFLVPIFAFKIFNKDAEYRDAKADEARKKEQTWSSMPTESRAEASAAGSGFVAIRRKNGESKVSSGPKVFGDFSSSISGVSGAERWKDEFGSQQAGS